MRAIVFDQPGDPDVLRLDNVPDPHPSSDAIPVRVHGTAVNRADLRVLEANRNAGKAALRVAPR
ncbi:MAG: hypothetical protein RMK84_06675 [Oscillochloridaceae bacterium]|nr:hypothetical protein [Chloroflexaceae bacterium]MDW8389793.1 hypothetical protein [Oscillochloridaceae bacterium]